MNRDPLSQKITEVDDKINAWIDSKSSSSNDERVNRQLEHLLYVTFRYAVRHSILFTISIVAVGMDVHHVWKLFTHHQLKMDGFITNALMILAIYLVNFFVYTRDSKGLPAVSPITVYDAFVAAGIDKPRFRTPQVLKLKTLKNGNLIVEISRTVPSKIFLDPEYSIPICGQLGALRIDSVEDVARNRIRLTFARTIDLESPTVPTNPPNGKVLLGHSHFGELWWDYEKHPHLGIFGKTGSGKSSLMSSIIYQVTQQDHRVLLIDPKGLDYQHLQDRVFENTADPGYILQFLNGILEEHSFRLEKLSKLRYTSLEQAQKNHELLEFSRWFIVFDEMAFFSIQSTSDKFKRENFSMINDRLKQIALTARATGIHLILSTQYAKAEILDTTIKQQLYLISGKVEDEVASRTMLGRAGAEELPYIPGRFVLSDQNLIEFQAARLP
ncbi:FtsK/SpoIIIE domain-containing protein [Alicyclobacillus tolerans]|uniref:FtsK/SpoIIIE domain-containing protein n=1 Tax=Alicyclobacillus tolerans TaxID=90970 RepID=UPI003B7A1D77